MLHFSRAYRCTKPAVFGLPALLLTVSLGEGRKTESANQSRPEIECQEIAATQRLRLEKPLSGALSAGECHLFQVELRAGQFLTLTIEHPGFDAHIEVLRPDRQPQVRYVRCPSSPTLVSLISDIAGDHLLRLCPFGSQVVDTPYRVSIGDIRSSAEADKIRIAGERAFAVAEELRVEWRAEASRDAIEKYGEALSHWMTAGLREEETRTLVAMGDVFHPLGELEEAQDRYQRALEISNTLGDLSGQGQAMRGLASVQMQLGNNQEAIELCDAAITRFQKIGDNFGTARALNLMGDIFGWNGDLQRSMEYYNKSLPLWRNLENRRGQAQTLLGFGYNYSDLGDDRKAIEYYNDALDLWQAVDDRRGQSLTLHALGYSRSNLGEKQEALNLFHRAQELTEPMGDDAASARLVNSMGRIYRELHEYQEALEYYKTALRLYQGVGFRSAEGDCLYNISRCYFLLKDAHQAEGFCLRALDVYHSLNDSAGAALVLRELGKIHGSLGRQDQALAAYEQALKLNRETRSRREEAYTLNDIGQFYHDLNEKKTALEHYQKALPICRETADPIAESVTRFNIARVMNDLAKPDEALSQIEEATKIIESLRSKIASHRLRSSYFASLHGYHVLHINLLMQMQQRPSGEWSSLAFQASEHARARSLLDSLSEARVDIRQGVEPDLLERERSLQWRLNAKAERQMRLLSGEPDEKELEAIAKEIRDLTKEYEQLQAQIRSKSPRYAALTQPEPLSLEGIQQHVLDDETLLLEYALGEERSFLWAVTDKAHTSHELPSREEIEESAQRVYELLTARQPKPEETVREYRARVRDADSQYWQEASRLSDMVLAPIADQLGDKRLLVVSDGALQYVPFGALPIPGATKVGDEPVPLVVEHEIVRLPSASTLAVLRRETEGRKVADKSVAVLADPVFELDDPRVIRNDAEADKATEEVLPEAPRAPPVVSDLHRALRDIGFMQGGRLRIPRLPSTRWEADAIIATAPPDASFKALDFQASRATATNADLGQYRIVHFATHGLLNHEHPELSGVILSMVDEQGRPQNGFLRLHDIYNLELPVDLVVLSACNSGLGKQVRGEGLIGIVRGFMYAGAERVVASLWKVDDEATGELMKIFYRGMLVKGLTPAAALREAQIAMWRQNDWRQPFYWAAFVLQGEWM